MSDTEKTELTEENKRLREALAEIMAGMEEAPGLVPLCDDGYRKCRFCDGYWREGRDEKHVGLCPLATARRVVGFYAPVKENAE
jgi:hypothetical protein